ncbi:MAG TPA: nickel-dependent lactate racemase, partial [Lachnospiraceae bacterium]|nr:nickel-dependent lactate racemase [Lachnospiraceae bacterium]
MEHISLQYGTSTVEFDIDGAKSVKFLNENEMRVIEDMKSEFLHSVTEGVFDSKPLNQILEKDDKVTIVISDMTRFWSRQDILCQLLVEYLNDAVKIPFENMVVLIALGSHRANTEEEKEKLASKYVYDNVKVVDHNCLAEDLIYVGTTSMGTKVSINPLAVGRKVICIGGTIHHVMAGYGGGRKSIVPGIASKETIRMNHQRALDPDKAMSDSRVGSGKTSQNPINLDMYEAAKFVDVVFGINIVMESSGKHSGLFCGNFDSAWRESCRYVQKGYGLPIDYEADIVIASCGGFPKDINLYQSTK